MAGYSRDIKYTCSREEAFDAAEKSLVAAGLVLGSRNAGFGVITAKKGVNLQTWGSSVEVKFDDRNGLHIKSNSFQLIDWGSNKKIVYNFEASFIELTGQAVKR